MQVRDYEHDVLRTAGCTTPKDMLINGVMGLCGESGEVIDQVKKWLHQGHPLNQDHMIEELGDCLYYLTETALAIGSTLGDVMEANVNKRKQRYPDGFSVEKSLHRDVV